MIPRTVPTWQVKSWQEELNQLIQSPQALLQRLELCSSLLPKAVEASAHFPLRVTESYVSRIEKGNVRDPLLLQVLPLAAELTSPADFVRDPLAEADFQPAPGIVHKYHSRVLFVAATQCAINCRYCFRRHFPYQDHQLSRQDWQQALAYVRNHSEINEVILSGGDPLSLSDKQLGWLTEQIATIPHIKRLRIHSRYPIILPSRVTGELIAALTGSRLPVIMVIHCNHAQEIDDNVRAGIARLRSAQLTILNQTVLLRDINDKSDILASLSEALFDCNVQPYYLHLLDKVKGAAHFLVDDDEAKGIYRDLLTLLPGYLVPKLVRETPHERSKTPVCPAS